MNEEEIILSTKEMCEFLQVTRVNFRQMKSRGTLEKRLEDMGYKLISSQKENGRNTNYTIKKIGEPKIRFPNLLIEEKYYDSIGIYKIVLNNEIYIGSTIAGFKNRFLTHRGVGNKLKTRKMLLEQGATFEILQICDGMSENEIRHIEQQWIEEYRNNPDWEVINIDDHVKRKGEQHGKSQNIPDNKIIKVKREDYDRALEILEREGIRVVQFKDMK